MAKNKLKLEFDGFNEMMARLDKIGGSQAMKKGVENALAESQKHVNKGLVKSLRKSNLPAKGRYGDASDLKQAIVSDGKTEWSGLTASIDIGFSFDEVGLKQIYLMRGRKNMKPVRGMESAIFGNKVAKEIKQIQEQAVSKTIKDIMEGK